MEEQAPAAKSPPIGKRELPEVNIFEKANFGDETVNDNVTNLQKEVRRTLKERNNIDGQCEAYNNLGTAYYRLFKYDKAEMCHYFHLQLGKPVLVIVPFQDKRPENKREQRIAMVNLGCVYHAKREYELALQTYRDALDIAEELEEDASKARILNNISNIYEDVCDFQSAIESQNQRMELVTNLGDVNGQIKCAASLGNLYCLMGELRSGIENYDKSVINLRMKIVKNQTDKFKENSEGGASEEKIEENPEFYDKEVS